MISKIKFTGKEYALLKVPFDINSVIKKAKSITTGAKLSKENRAIVEDKLAKLKENLVALFGQTQGKMKREITENALAFSFHILDHYISSKQVIMQHNLTTDGYDNMLDDIWRRMCKAMIPAGTMYGISSGGAITQPATQGTLNSFHKSGKGDASLSLGKAAMMRVLAVTHTENCIDGVRMFIYIKPEYVSKLDSIVAQFIYYDMRVFLDNVTVPNIKFTGSSDVFAEMPEVRKTIELFKRQHGGEMQQSSVIGYPVILRFNDAKLFQKKIDLQSIYVRIKQYLTNSTVMSNGKNMIVIFVSINDVESQPNMLYRNFEKLVSLLPDLAVSGYNGIKSIDILSDNNGDKFLMAVGTNVREIFKNNKILREKTYSIDIYETWENFGLCAAINVIYKNLVMIFTEYGGNINYGALKMLANMMCSNGTIAPIDNTGLSKNGAGILQRMVFERPFNVLPDAAKLGLTDNMDAPMANIIHAQSFKGGTGLCDVLV